MSLHEESTNPVIKFAPGLTEEGASVEEAYLSWRPRRPWRTRGVIQGNYSVLMDDIIMRGTEIHSESVTPRAFWPIVKDLTAGMEIRPEGRQMLRDMIDAGVGKMQSEGRVTSTDIGRAGASLATFIMEMKYQAGKLGHPGWLGEDTAREAAIRFQTMLITLWPFTPPPWSRG
jgi:hypothetical protein